MKFRNALIAVLAGIALLVAGASTIGAQPADDPPPPTPIVDDELNPVPTMSKTDEPIVDEVLVDHNTLEGLSNFQFLTVKTSVKLSSHMLTNALDEKVHERTSGFFGDELSSNEYFGIGRYSERSNEFYSLINERGTVHDTLFNHIGANDHWYGPLFVNNPRDDGRETEVRLVDKFWSAAHDLEIDWHDTCVEYSLVAKVVEDGRFLLGSVDEKITVWCPSTRIFFDNYAHSNLWAYSNLWSHRDHEDLMRHTMHKASNFVHETIWDGREAIDNIAVSDSLDLGRNVKIYVEIVVELISRDTATNLIALAIQTPEPPLPSLLIETESN